MCIRDRVRQARRPFTFQLISFMLFSLLLCLIFCFPCAAAEAQHKAGHAANDVKFTMVVSILSMACWRLGYRMEWEDAFRAYLLALDAKKPVIPVSYTHLDVYKRQPCW